MAYTMRRQLQLLEGIRGMERTLKELGIDEFGLGPIDFEYFTEPYDSAEDGVNVTDADVSELLGYLFGIELEFEEVEDGGQSNPQAGD